MKKIISSLLVSAMLTLLLPINTFADVRKNSDLVIVAFGDSITAAGKWQQHLSTTFGINIINAGVAGDSTNSAMPRFQSQVLDKKPDVVFISFGTNDSALDTAKYVPLETYKENLNYYIDECEKIGAKVIINIPPPVVDSLYLTRHDSAPFEQYGGPNGIVAVYAQAAKEVAISRGLYYADHNTAFKAIKNYASYFPDGVHPSDTGYELYADTVAVAYDKLWKGDVDLNGTVDQLDYILLKRHCFKTYELDEFETQRTDINNDGTVDYTDYLLVKRICYGTYVVE